MWPRSMFKKKHAKGRLLIKIEVPDIERPETEPGAWTSELALKPSKFILKFCKVDLVTVQVIQ